MARITGNNREGDQFSGKAKKMAFERLWTFSGGKFAGTGWPSKNTHTDLDFARERGLRTAIASGTQFEGHMVQLMIDLFGVKWLSHGTMDVKFTGPVEVDDVVVAHALVTKKTHDSGVAGFILKVWVENQKGEKVLVGTATGSVNQ